VPKVFSSATLGVFADACASIPLRPLDRAFEAAGIRPGTDPEGGVGGARRTQFRRYLARVDQHDPKQLKRLGAALGALIAEVATSKQDFLVKAAERDGFVFANGVFEIANTTPHAFAVTSAEDFASLEDRARRLYVLANENPKDALAGAYELVESVCRVILRLRGAAAAPKATGLVDLATSTIDILQVPPARAGDAKKSAGVIWRSVEQLGTIVAGLARPRPGSDAPRHARLAIGAAVALASFLAETHLER
jgi:hypothetical protein